MPKKILFSSFMLILVFSCTKKPQACIDNGQSSGSVGQELVFTSCSKHTLSQEWFMTGPAGAPENTMGWSDPQVKHTFTVSGTYIVTLHAYSKFSSMGDVSTATQTVVIN